MIVIITIHAIIGQNDLYSLFCKMRNAVFYKSASGDCRNLSLEIQGGLNWRDYHC